MGKSALSENWLVYSVSGDVIGDRVTLKVAGGEDLEPAEGNTELLPQVQVRTNAITAAQDDRSTLLIIVLQLASRLESP